jgi:hypothetical protein
LLVQEPSTNTPQLREAISYTPLIEALPEVKAVSPQITGAGFLRRGTQVAQVSIIGLEPGRESAISDLEGYLVDGEVRLRSGAVLLGKSLVDDMGLALGQTISLESTDGIKAALTLTGIYQIGTGGGPDRRMAYVSLATARTLFEMPQGVSRIEIKLFDLYAADAVALRVEGLTGLDAKSWTEDGAQLLEVVALVRRDDVERLEVVLDVDAELGPLLLLELLGHLARVARHHERLDRGHRQNEGRRGHDPAGDLTAGWSLPSPRVPNPCLVLSRRSGPSHAPSPDARLGRPAVAQGCNLSPVAQVFDLS